MAERRHRLSAFLLDALGLYLVLLLCYVLAELEPWPSAVLLLAWLIVNLWYLSRRGQTVGKRLAGLRIVRVDGQRCGLLRAAFVRSLYPYGALISLLVAGWSSPWLLLLLLLDVLPVAGIEQRCLHDCIADTKVVNV